MYKHYYKLFALLLILHSCSLRNPFIPDAPYYYNATATINRKECNIMITELHRNSLYDSDCYQPAPQFLTKTINGNDIVAFQFETSHSFRYNDQYYVFPCYWICGDSVIEDSKKYFFDDDFKQLFAEDDTKQWHLNSGWPTSGAPDEDIIIEPINGGLLLSGWMSFTKKTDHLYLSYSVLFEFDILGPQNEIIQIRDGRLDIAKKYIDLEQSTESLFNRNYYVPIE